MSKETDPSLYESGFDRIEGDRYWTDPWVTQALLDTYKPRWGTIWEPACGRGDIVRVLLENKPKGKFITGVVASDVDMSEFITRPNFDVSPFTHNFLTEDFNPGADSIVTNPPFGRNAQKFVERALAQPVRIVAMLLRSEFRSGKTRKHLFGDNPTYVGEIVLTSRPRWDWWFRDRPEASPRHNFSWFVWDNNKHLLNESWQRFHYRR